MPVSAYWHLLRDNRNMRLLWMAQVVSELGDWFYSIAIFSFLLEVTGSARLVSVAFLMMVLPQVLMSPAAGVINDRLSREGDVVRRLGSRGHRTIHDFRAVARDPVAAVRAPLPRNHVLGAV